MIFIALSTEIVQVIINPHLPARNQGSTLYQGETLISKDYP